MPPQMIFSAPTPVATSINVFSGNAFGLRAAGTPFSLLGNFRGAIHRVLAMTASLAISQQPSVPFHPHVATRTFEYSHPTRVAPPSASPFVAVILFAGLSGGILVYFRLRRPRSRPRPVIHSADDLVSPKSCYSECSTLINPDGISFPPMLNLLFRSLAGVIRLLHVPAVVDFIERKAIELGEAPGGKLVKDIFNTPGLKPGIVATAQDTVVMLARLNQTDNTLVNTPWSYPRFTKGTTTQIEPSNYDKYDAPTPGSSALSPSPADILGTRAVEKDLKATAIRPYAQRKVSVVDAVPTGDPVGIRTTPEGPSRMDTGTNTVASTTLFVGSEKPRAETHAEILNRINLRLAGLKCYRSSSSDSPLAVATRSDIAALSPVEPSDVPGKGKASSESPYVAEVRRIFETPLDVPLERRQYPDLGEPKANSQAQAQVHRIFQRVFDEIDKPGDPLPNPAGMNNMAHRSTDKDVGEPSNRVHEVIDDIDKSRRPALKSSVAPSEERKGTPAERARARVDQITQRISERVHARLLAEGKSTTGVRLLNSLLAGANKPAEACNEPRDPVVSNLIANSEPQNKPMPQRTERQRSLSCHDHVATSRPPNRRSLSTTRINSAEEASGRIARITQLRTTLDSALPLNRPPVCDDSAYARRDALVDEVERLFMAPRIEKTKPQQQNLRHVEPATPPVMLLEPALPILSDFDYKLRNASSCHACSSPTKKSSKNESKVPKSSSNAPSFPHVITDVFYAPCTPPPKETRVKTIRDLSFDFPPLFGFGSPASRRRNQLFDDNHYFTTSTPRINFAHFHGFSTSTPRQGYKYRRDTWASFF